MDYFVPIMYNGIIKTEEELSMNNYFYNQFTKESKKPFVVIVAFEDFGRVETIAFGKKRKL